MSVECPHCGRFRRPRSGPSCLHSPSPALCRRATTHGPDPACVPLEREEITAADRVPDPLVASQLAVADLLPSGDHETALIRRR